MLDTQVTLSHTYCRCCQQRLHAIEEYIGLKLQALEGTEGSEVEIPEGADDTEKKALVAKAARRKREIEDEVRVLEYKRRMLRAIFLLTMPFRLVAGSGIDEQDVQGLERGGAKIEGQRGRGQRVMPIFILEVLQHGSHPCCR